MIDPGHRQLVTSCFLCPCSGMDLFVWLCLSPLSSFILFVHHFSPNLSSPAFSECHVNSSSFFQFVIFNLLPSVSLFYEYLTLGPCMPPLFLALCLPSVSCPGHRGVSPNTETITPENVPARNSSNHQCSACLKSRLVYFVWGWPNCKMKRNSP